MKIISANSGFCLRGDTGGDKYILIQNDDCPSTSGIAIYTYRGRRGVSRKGMTTPEILGNKNFLK
jgi:hypothetical protein